MDKETPFGEGFRIAVRQPGDGSTVTPHETLRKATMNIGTIAAIGIACMLVGGCAETPTKASLGSVAGTLTGGLVGGRKPQAIASEPPSAVVAPLYATWEASDIGRLLDDGDRRIAAEADFQALEQGAAGVTRDWSNPTTGRKGQVTPGAAYAVNQYTCRDFVDVVSIDGRRETRRSTACRQPDGSWRPIS